MPKAKQKNTRILIQLPVDLKQYLDDLKLEGYTASAYIRGLLTAIRKSRIETGWRPGRAFITHELDYPKARRRRSHPSLKGD